MRGTDGTGKRRRPSRRPAKRDTEGRDTARREGDSPQGKGFHRFDEIRRCLEKVLAVSVADETEIVWLERRCGRASSREDDAPSLENPRLSVLVRVVEAGRQGWFRTDTADSNQLESGVRQALAMSKVSHKLKRCPVLPTDDDEFRAPRRLLDPEISRLSPGTARKQLSDLCEEDEEARLTWTDTRLFIMNSHGMVRSSASTEATMLFESGRGPGSGRAAASARRLAELDPAVLREQARRCRGPEDIAQLPTDPVPVVLSPEATIQWLNVLNAFAFSGRSFLDGTSFLSRHRNVQVFDRKFNLRDDGTASGLPIAFDFEGSRKRPLDLIVDGKPSTPALNHVQSVQAGFAPTAQAVGGQDALFSNLFLMPGEASEEDLLADGDGGIRVGWFESTECFEPSQLRVRMVARGVRRIEGGTLGPCLPDFVWHESLLGALARLRTLGEATVVLAVPTTPLGGISAPSIVLEESSGFQGR